MYIKFQGYIYPIYLLFIVATCTEAWSSCNPNTFCLADRRVLLDGFNISIYASDQCGRESEDGVTISILEIAEFTLQEEFCENPADNPERVISLQISDYECKYEARKTGHISKWFRNKEDGHIISIEISLSGNLVAFLQPTNDCFQGNTYSRNAKLLDDMVGLGVSIQGLELQDDRSIALKTLFNFNSVAENESKSCLKVSEPLLNSFSYFNMSITGNISTTVSLPNWFSYEVPSNKIATSKAKHILSQLTCQEEVPDMEDCDCTFTGNASFSLLISSAMNRIKADGLPTNFYFNQSTIRVQKLWIATKEEIIRANIGAGIVLCMIVVGLLFVIILKKRKGIRKAVLKYDDSLFCYDVRGTVEPDWRPNDNSERTL